MKIKKCVIESINISQEKGVIKIPINSAEITKYGISGDAHSGSWHRQISILSLEEIAAFSQKAGRKIKNGEFAENLTCSGLNLKTVKLFDKFKIGDVVLEVTQFGKECHGSSCAIYREVGACIMPQEGIFCRVLNGGKIKAGDFFEHLKNVFKIGIITLSDRASKGEYQDLSGPKIREIMHDYCEQNRIFLKIENVIIPDEEKELKKELSRQIEGRADVIFTTGGTGIGKRDITIEAVRPMLDKEIPGIMELIRVKYGQENYGALLSRSIAGVAKDSLIFTLPGSLKAVEEYLREINKVLKHSLFMLRSVDMHN